ncbi:hypothetical protein Syun_001437 [Stephania yunnanensis]|uniref:Uncharacterized protein n=1 Tax=Stephania yunnanensis TaxID=152371 RepID=A0AAP0Q6A1_9MAGN
MMRHRAVALRRSPCRCRCRADSAAGLAPLSAAAGQLRHPTIRRHCLADIAARRRHCRRRAPAAFSLCSLAPPPLEQPSPASAAGATVSRTSRCPRPAAAAPVGASPRRHCWIFLRRSCYSIAPLLVRRWGAPPSARATCSCRRVVRRCRRGAPPLPSFFSLLSLISLFLSFPISPTSFSLFQLLSLSLFFSFLSLSYPF